MSHPHSARIAQRVIDHVGADNIINGHLPTYAWPGGYPLFYITEQGSILCPAHASAEHEYSDELIVDADVNWEDDALYCEHGERIESAYRSDES
jgi:hypothetical protein